MNKTTHKITETYPIPSIIYPKIGKFGIALYFMVFIGLPTLSYSVGKSINEPWYINTDFLAFMVLLDLMYLFMLYVQLTKKEYVQLTDTALVVKGIFKKKSINWERIESVETFHAGKRGLQLRVKGSILMDEQFSKPEELIINIQTKYFNISVDKMIHTINKVKNQKITAELWEK